MMNSKKGISILAVLLFMLIATIAGTATYKWLSSEGKTSASRMFQSEARMAALAGIESARSWFATHGNEAGAIVRQVQNAKKKNTVVRLDNQLVPIKKDKQNYSVYAVDVDVSQQPYKLKIISEGSSRDGTAKHSETAVFKVMGLYQVSIPVNTSDLDYNYAYFGGSTTMGTNTKAESMLINGDLDGSQISVSDRLVVTGNVAHKGTDHLGLANTSCIGGNLKISNSGLESAGDLYVAGNVTNLLFSSNVYETEQMIKGSVYFGGDVSNAEDGGAASVIIANNMTLAKGTMTTAQRKRFEVLGNMCLGDGAKINFNSLTSGQGGFTVGGDVWIPDDGTLYNSSANNYSSITLGGVGYKAYIGNSDKCPSGGSYQESSGSLQVSTSKQEGFTDCPSNMYYKGSLNAGVYNPYGMFATNATLHKVVSESAAKDGVECSERVVETCEKLLTTASDKACTDGSKYKIDDLLQTASATFGKKASSCVTTALDVDNSNLQNGEGIDKLNKCFEDANGSDLYNGYLVVKATATKLSTVFKNPNNKKLKGKFIIYVDETASSSVKFTGRLPATELYSGKKSIVFLYLPNGAGELMKSGSGDHNYFVYSEGNIAKLQTPSDGASYDWYGSFYLTASNCSKIDEVADRQNFNYDKEIVTDLTNSGVICSATATGCGESMSTSTSGGSSSTGSSTQISMDSIHVAVGSNLILELESQYKATEKISKIEDVAPSVVVLPRVVYLNSNSEGKLSDYYNPIALLNVNGSLTSSNVSCTYSKLTQNPLPVLDEGTNATCTYTGSIGDKSYKSGFYVVVLGSANETPKVGFDGDAYVSVDMEDLATQGTTTIPIVMNIGGANGTGEYSMEILVSGKLSWISSTNTGLGDKFEKISESGNTARYRLKGNVSTEAMQVLLFNVTLTSSDVANNLVFKIDKVENCMPYASVKAIALRGSKRIERKGLADYCTAVTNAGLVDDSCSRWTSTAYQNTPSCDELITKNFGNTYEWVTATGDECSVLTPNDAWKCFTASSATLIEKNYSSISKYCDVRIPNTSLNTITTFTEGTQYLYAEAKRKKHMLHVDLTNPGSAEVYYSTSPVDVTNWSNAVKSLTKLETCSKEDCSYEVYSGYHLYLKGISSSANKFSTWKRNTAAQQLVSLEGNPIHILVESDTTAYGYFNVADEHCFYDNFDGTSIFDGSCNSGDRTCNLIDRCTENTPNANCSLSSGHTYNGADGAARANWTMVYANTPQNCIEYGTELLFRCKEHELLAKDYGTCCYRPGYYKPLKKGNSVSANTIYFRRGGLNGDDHKDGQVSVLLHRVDAGTNGTLTASFDTETIAYTANKTDKVLFVNVAQFLNSGFILRSNENASEYLMLQVYGQNVTGSDLFAGYTMVARVCYVNAANANSDGRSLNDASTCISKSLSFGNLLNGLSAPFQKLNLEAKIQGNSLDVTVGQELITTTLNMRSVHFNLDTLPGTFKSLYNESSSNLNNRVGIKMADDNFKVVDVAWRAEGEDCWDTPYATCSFASNYIGGRAPLKEDVMPWVNTSTWLSDKVESGKCDLEYYYNGCDMAEGRFANGGIKQWLEGVASIFVGARCTTDSSNGLYWDTQDNGKDGTKLKNGAKYNFTYEGIHGKQVSVDDEGYSHNGIVRNASVRVTCDGMKRSYIANCGTFWVGSIDECTDNETLLPKNVEENGTTVYRKDKFVYPDDVSYNQNKELVLYEAVNLRNAKLHFTFEQGTEVSFYLVDKNGYTSTTGSAKASDENGVDVNKLIDQLGFDPQNVTSIVFTASSDVVITSITSECANAPVANCNYAEYNSQDGKWRLTGSASGDVCEMSIVNGSSKAEGQVVCRSEGAMVLSSDAARTLVKDITEETTFKVSLKVSKNGSTPVTCVTTATVAPGTGSSSVVSPMPRAVSAKSASCSKGEDGIYHVVVTGCDSYDNCSVKTQRNDYPAEVACNWVTSECDVALYYPGTYDILFNDGTSDHRLAGCSGVVFEEGENNE